VVALAPCTAGAAALSTATQQTSSGLQGQLPPCVVVLSLTERADGLHEFPHGSIANMDRSIVLMTEAISTIFSPCWQWVDEGTYGSNQLVSLIEP
jgi:hypothetical protein